MLNVATTRATPANTSRKFWKKPRKSPWMSSSCSAVSAAPVRASTPSGRTPSMRDTRSAWLTPGSAFTRMLDTWSDPGTSSRAASSSLNAV